MAKNLKFSVTFIFVFLFVCFWVAADVMEQEDHKTGDKNTPGKSEVQSYEGASNTAYGLTAGVSITTGNRNSFFGRGAGEATTSGQANTFLGMEA